MCVGWVGGGEGASAIVLSLGCDIERFILSARVERVVCDSSQPLAPQPIECLCYAPGLSSCQLCTFFWADYYYCCCCCRVRQPHPNPPQTQHIHYSYSHYSPHIVLPEPVWRQAVEAHVHARVLNIHQVNTPVHIYSWYIDSIGSKKCAQGSVGNRCV